MGESVLSVSSLNQLARQVLEGGLGRVSVVGEISTLRTPASGHRYFVLKDERAQVRCALFRQAARQVAYTPTEGDEVVVTADVTLYEARGDYQLIVRSIQPAGGGRLAQLFEALKRRLAAEGLFDEGRKRALPPLPRHIAVISSASGAAIQDVRSVLARRLPAAEVVLFPVAVQGDEAAGQLRMAIESISASDRFDVVLVVRGGGSIEDLWAFNDEALARSIAACPKPVVSGVGHEIDFTICDFVADQRAATPTAAAELVTATTQQSMLEQLVRNMTRAQQLIEQRLERLMQRCDRLDLALRHHGPRRQLDQADADVARLLVRAQLRIRSQLQSGGSRLHVLEQRLQRSSPQVALRRAETSFGSHRQRLIQSASQYLRDRQARLAQLDRRLAVTGVRDAYLAADSRLQALQQRLERVTESRVARARQRFDSLNQTLVAINPLRVLERGYAVIGSESGVVSRAAQLSRPGQVIDIRFHDGHVGATTSSYQPDGD